MTELEKMEHAKQYLDQLADGIDPLTGRELPDDTVLNQVRLSRCFFYVSDVLRRVIENGGKIQRKAVSSKKRKNGRIFPLRRTKGKGGAFQSSAARHKGSGAYQRCG